MELRTRTTTATRRHEGWYRRVATAVVTSLTLATAGILAAAPAAAAVSSGAGADLNAGRVTGQFTADGSGGAAFSGHTALNTSAAETSTITVGSDRTYLPMSSMSLDSNDTLQVVVRGRSDIVVIHVFSGVATIGGRLEVRVGSPSGPFGGNVWIMAPGGVDLGPNAVVDTGGLLATTQVLAHADLFDGNPGFSFADAPGGSGPAGVLLQAGSRVNGNGGLLAFAAPSVQQIASSVVDDLSAGSDSDVLFAGAQEFGLSLVGDSDGDQDLGGFVIPGGGATTAATPVAVAGTVTAGNVYLVSDSSAASAFGPVIYPVATIGANGAAASRNGSLVVVSGGGVARDDAAAFARAVPRAGAAPQPITLSDAVSGGYQVVVASSGDLTISGGGSLTAQEVILSTGGDLVNSVGNGAVSASNRWLVYAPTPADVPDPGLNSGTQAYWGSTIDTRPPASVPGLTQSRYLFAQSRTLTFTATDDIKVFGATPPLTWTDDFAAVMHPGVTGLFTADTRGWAVSGDPAISSTGQPASAKVPLVGYHPIDVEQGGSQFSPGGYGLAFVDGKLWVEDTTAPGIGVVAAGTLVNGWYNTDVAVDWTVVEPESETAENGCTDFTITADQPATDYTCVVDTFHFPDTSVTLPDVQRDATDPDVTAAGSVGSSGITEGTWTNQDVLVDFSCTDNLSGVDQLSSDITVTSAQLVNGQCTDVAGNTDAVAYQVNIDKAAPTIGTVTASSDGQPYAAGTWVDEDVTVTWTCADTGGSGVVLGTDSVTRATSGTVTPRCRDHAGNETSGSPFRVNIIWGYGVGFDRPVDPSPVVNVARLGRVVPVKAAVTAYDLPVTGSSTQPISLGVTRISCATGNVDGVEVYAAAGASNTGNLFRWDAGSSRWLYNLDTGGLGLAAGSCARVAVYYGGEVVRGIASGGFPVGGFQLRLQR